MNRPSNLKIIVFVGPSGAGKSTATHHFTQSGFPKVSSEYSGAALTAQQVIDQVDHLVGAGQHRIVIDGIHDEEEFKALRHAFPGEVTTVAINKTVDNIMVADYSVINDGTIEQLYEKLDALAVKIDFS